MHKEAVLAHNASWLYRVAPYLIFAATWVAAALVPTYATGLLFSWSADLIAIVALLGTARFTLALAGMDVGTAFGGIGVLARDDDRVAGRARHAADRVHRRAGRRHHPALRHRRPCSPPARSACGCRSGSALFAFLFVAIAENARIPIDNPATHLELTMVHEAMVLEYSGRHLAMIEAAAALKLVLYFSLIVCLFVPFGMATGDRGRRRFALGIARLSRQDPRARGAAADRRDQRRQDAGVPLSDLPRRRVRRGGARGVSAVRVAGASDGQQARCSTSPICSPAACWS